MRWTQLIFNYFTFNCLCWHIIQGKKNLNEADPGPGPGQPLFLTPLIHAGEVEEAREQALVTNFTNVISYSGFFTVNESCNANLFFWFFPAAIHPEKAPLLIWLNCGPGETSMFGLFVEIGPFYVDSKHNIHFRNTAWTQTHSVLFIDSPAGTGFSFTDSDAACYPKTQEDVAFQIANALEQFYLLFPEYKDRELYIAGQNYAGKYATTLASEIHRENQEIPRECRVNLKGLILGGALLDFKEFLHWSQVLYNFGLLDHLQVQVFQEQEAKVRQLIDDKKWLEASKVIQSIILNQSTTTLLKNLTGLSTYYNILQSTIPPDFINFIPFIQQNYIRKALHVGNLPFHNFNNLVAKYLAEDIPQSVSSTIENLLNEGLYRILYYSGQLDLIASPILSEKLLSSWNWNGAEEFRNVQRKIWKFSNTNEIAGYVKESKQLTFVILRNSGHILPYDQPKWGFDLINRFTTNKSFSS